MTKVITIKRALNEALREEIPDDADIPKLLVAAVKSLDTNTGSMEVTLGLMEALQLETKVYRTQLVEATSDISVEAIGTGVAVDIVGRTIKRITAWLVEEGPQFFFNCCCLLASSIFFV